MICGDILLTAWQTTSISRRTQLCGVSALIFYSLTDSRLVRQYRCLYPVARRWGREFPHPSRPATGPHPASCLLAGGQAAGLWRCKWMQVTIKSECESEWQVSESGGESKLNDSEWKWQWKYMWLTSNGSDRDWMRASVWMWQRVTLTE